MEHINFHEVNDNASKDDYTYIAHNKVVVVVALVMVVIMVVVVS